MKHFITVTIAFALLLFTGCKKDALHSGNDYKSLGASAQHMLSASLYQSLHIEVSYMPGYEPDDAALRGLASFLDKYLHKPGGIHITSHAIEASGKQSLSLNDVVNIERKNRQTFTRGGALAVHILFADAQYAQPDDLAIAYWNTSICLFGKRINAKIAGFGGAGKTNVYTALLQHEFGHLLGLVGQGSPQQVAHRDEDNGAHCSNAKCLMYYQVETNSPALSVPPLDADCLNDLKANGGK